MERRVATLADIFIFSRLKNTTAISANARAVMPPSFGLIS